MNLLERLSRLLSVNVPLHTVMSPQQIFNIQAELFDKRETFRSLNGKVVLWSLQKSAFEENVLVHIVISAAFLPRSGTI